MVEKLLELHEWFSKQTGGASLFDKAEVAKKYGSSAVNMEMMDTKHTAQQPNNKNTKRREHEGSLLLERWNDLRTNKEEMVSTDDLVAYSRSLTSLFPNAAQSIVIVDPYVAQLIKTEIINATRKGTTESSSSSEFKKLADDRIAHIARAFVGIKLNPFRASACDILLFPMNFDDLHWILIAFHIIRGEVYVYDSNVAYSGEYDKSVPPRVSIYSKGTFGTLKKTSGVHALITVMTQLHGYYQSGQWIRAIKELHKNRSSGAYQPWMDYYAPLQAVKERPFDFPSDKRRLVLDMPQQNSFLLKEKGKEKKEEEESSSMDCGVWLGLILHDIYQAGSNSFTLPEVAGNLKDKLEAALKTQKHSDISSLIREWFTGVVRNSVSKQPTSK